MLLDGDALAAGKAYFQLGGDAPFARPSAVRLVGRRQGLGIRHAARARPRDRHRPRRHHPGRRRLAGVDRGFIRLLLRAARRQSPPLARLSPSARHSRRPTTRWSTRRRTSRYFVSLGQLQSGRFAEISVHDHETSECLADRPRRSRRDAVAGRGARNVGAIRRRASSGLERRRDAGHPHQCGRRGRLQDRARAARPPGPRELARSRAAPARHVHPLGDRARGLADPARARGRPAAHRGAPASRAAKSTPSRLPRRPIRSARKAATSSRPTGCASTIRR